MMKAKIIVASMMIMMSVMFSACSSGEKTDSSRTTVTKSTDRSGTQEKSERVPTKSESRKPVSTVTPAPTRKVTPTETPVSTVTATPAPTITTTPTEVPEPVETSTPTAAPTKEPESSYQYPVRTTPEPEDTNPNGYDMSNYSDGADLYDDYEDDFEDEEEAEDYYDDYGE